ncbi:TatD family hydrolase, partial [Achromobacter xylosoxidans]
AQVAQATTANALRVLPRLSAAILADG